MSDLAQAQGVMARAVLVAGNEGFIEGRDAVVALLERAIYGEGDLLAALVVAGAVEASE